MDDLAEALHVAIDLAQHRHGRAPEAVRDFQPPDKGRPARDNPRPMLECRNPCATARPAIPSIPNEFRTCPKDQKELLTASELQPGMVLRGKYEILGKLGAGGMAAVYRARHLAFGEVRAIKVVEQPPGRRRGLPAPLPQRSGGGAPAAAPERRARRRPRHDRGRPSVHRHGVRGGPQPPRGGPPARGALAAPRGGHRAAGRVGAGRRPRSSASSTATSSPTTSCSPATGPAETAKVLDFGIAKMKEGALGDGRHVATRTGMVVGTPQYISPEQAMGRRGDELDGRADLYSLGVVLYEMVTGRLPFESDTAMGIILHHLQTPPHAAARAAAGPRHPRAALRGAAARLAEGAGEALPLRRGDGGRPRRGPGPAAAGAGRGRAGRRRRCGAAR